MEAKKVKKALSINVAILGPSGYTGAEIIRLLSKHPKNVSAITTKLG